LFYTKNIQICIQRAFRLQVETQTEIANRNRKPKSQKNETIKPTSIFGIGRCEAAHNPKMEISAKNKRKITNSKQTPKNSNRKRKENKKRKKLRP